MAWPLVIEANKILISEGEDSHSMYLVQEGTLIVTQKRGDEDVVLGYVISGEPVGELSFIDQKPRSATVRSTTECKLIQIPQKTFEDFFKSQPPWIEVFIKTLASRLRKADARIRI